MYPNKRRRIVRRALSAFVLVAVAGGIAHRAGAATGPTPTGSSGPSPAMALPAAPIRLTSDFQDGLTDGASFGPQVSADGRLIAFVSNATDLVRGDTNGKTDVFVYDRAQGTTRRVSVASSGAQADGDSRNVKITADGRHVVFASNASNLTGEAVNQVFQVYLKSLETGSIRRVTDGLAHNQPDDDSFPIGVSDDLQTIAFVSFANNLVAGESDTFRDLYIRRLGDLTTTRVARQIMSNGDADMTPDGKYIAYTSLLSASSIDRNNISDVYRLDVATGARTLMSRSNSLPGTMPSYSPSISDDGQRVVFDTQANNFTNDTNGVSDVVLATPTNGVTYYVSGSPTDADGGSYSPEISGDGLIITFQSYATNITASPTNAVGSIFVNRGGKRTQVSVGNYGQPNDRSSGSALSRTGAVVAFASDATNLVSSGPENMYTDMFFRYS